ncbi:Uncharacterised protein [Enterobacter cloacae]|uniref:hypothetical protein n=2 Tax=Enterobacter cloacae complex TaxID=354276 RepID=UPI00079ABB92|nr:hypothetical protein AI2797V1_3443 [Enterobacter cloacae]CAE7821023.1 hypothetical protein AI2802V1_3428 [Enterobacter cloacae]CAH3819462.1 hypothetical protein AI2797V1_3443 [Enterobacter cloacae]CAH4004130.1 hypothetical protein AI2802V1_3428 [Enterobacter cloacae]SAE77989.1 Uncharacterised protein [Enterobacter cloacae]
MSKITREFTKEQLQQIEAAAKEVLWPVVWSGKKAREHFCEKITPKVVLKLARIALERIDAKAVALRDERSGSGGISKQSGFNDLPHGTRLYAVPPAPVVPEGWIMVPIEPTESMIVDGFESEPDEDFSQPEVWEEYQEMSGCQQAAHRAKLCWEAMIKAAPKPENI